MRKFLRGKPVPAPPQPQLPDGAGEPEELPQLPGKIAGRRDYFKLYFIPGLLILALLVGVFILAYGIGLDRGKRAANDERDAFYQERIARLVGNNPDSNATTTPGAKGALQALARVDQVQGDKLTLVLLNSGGTPTGVSLVILVDKSVQVYKTTEGQTTELHPGDNVLVNGNKVGDNYVARNIVILPPAG